MCVACRKSQDKKSLVRLVRTPTGVIVDETGKLPGRGAYLHADPSCWGTGVKKSLQKALNTTLTEDEIDRLGAYLEATHDDAIQDQQDPITGE
jgi:predicted RNA-binding protein YlxR (DUF448 family)